MLLAEVASLKNRTNEMEKECKWFYIPSTYTVNDHAYPLSLHIVLHKAQQCNKYKGELVQFRKQNNMSTDDIPLDEG